MKLSDWESNLVVFSFWSFAIQLFIYHIENNVIVIVMHSTSTQNDVKQKYFPRLIKCLYFCNLEHSIFVYREPVV